ncbi:MAG: damage-inducible protein CinA [Rhizobiales bacterium PAR1]|nr:MAG: damage-inducible protein CinA [Rhizobiales bacterium PAR1]
MPAKVTVPALARRVLSEARKNGYTIATAESCTGGMVAAALTSIAGSSDVFDRGFVTYSNAAKSTMIGVPAKLIESVGAVSAEVAAAMAEGALRASGAGLTVALTGVAGPGGGTDAKPVGLVHMAAAAKDGRVMRAEHRYDPALGRAGIRRAAMIDALEMLLDLAASGTHFA